MPGLTALVELHSSSPYLNCLITSIRFVGARSIVPTAPARIHHQANNPPLSLPFDCLMIRFAFTPRIKATNDPSPPIPVIERAKASPSILLTLTCNANSGSSILKLFAFLQLLNIISLFCAILIINPPDRRLLA